MFTGIIEKIGTLRKSETSPEREAKLEISTGFMDLALGESVAVNGVCLTATKLDSQGSALFYVSRETLDRTQLGDLRAGDTVNLERALTLSARLSGHLVQGHVDGVGRLLKTAPDGEGVRIQVEIPSRLARYCIEKGSIALNGVSLTINSIEDATHVSVIGITLIPHTWKHTQFSNARPGDTVNIEVDMLAKYAERIQSHRPTEKTQ